MEGCSFRITRLLTFLFAALILQVASGASAEQETKSQSGGSAPAQSGPPLVCVYLKNFGAVRDFTASQLQEHLVKFLSDPIFGVKPVTLKKGDSRYCDYLLTIERHHELGDRLRSQNRGRHSNWPKDHRRGHDVRSGRLPERFSIPCRREGG
jgi:hypothetical protein